MPPLPPWGWWRAHTGWAEPQDDPGPGQRALADQGGGGAARSCVTIKMLTKYAFGEPRIAVVRAQLVDSFWHG